MSRLSIASRLTLLLASVTVLVLLALGVAISFSVRHNLVAQDYAELENKAALIADIARSATPSSRAERLADALAHHPDMAFAVRDDEGRVLFSTAPGELLAYARQQPADSRPLRHDWVLADGHRFHALHLRQPLPEGSGLSVLLAIDDSRHAAFLQHFQQLLAACILAAALASSLLGGYVVRRTLQPLRRLAEQARQVTAERLHQRLSSTGAPVELQQLAQTLNGMLARLQDDFGRLAAFSADLAHELRTPITNMLTQVHVVLAHPRSNEAYRDTLASCGEELQRLSQIVGDLLYLAQAESSSALPSRATVAVAPLVDTLLEFYGLLAEDRHVQIRREGEATLEGNGLMLHRALANLLSNALQHAVPGTTVWVALQQEGAYCRIRVGNIGPPIAADVLPRLFDRFYRAPRPRGPRPAGQQHEGAGLGLAITRAIAQAHGGRVEVVSDAAGTVFSLVLPRHGR